MKSCPTSNMNKSTLWGFDVGQIVASFFVLAATNIVLSIFGGPLILSWGFGLFTLTVLRIVSHGQKNGHLELLFKYCTEAHLYLGHSERRVK